ncbi:MAG: DUF4388 domain-containing protein [Acidobacteriota bacterium]
MSDEVLQGDLAAFRLPAVLTFLSNGRKSGTLSLTLEDKEALLFFDDGALVFAGSNQESFRLGAILLRKKKITPEQGARINELMLREAGRYGDLAVQESVLTEEQLRDFLKVQVSEIVYDAFVWDGGRFSFFQDTSLPSYAVTIAIDLPNLIMEGARRIDEWAQCLRLLPDKSVVFRVVATPRDEKITLTVDEWKILFLINGQRSLAELCADTDEPLRIYRVIYGLYANKLIEKVRGARTETGNTGRHEAIDPVDDTIRQSSPRFGAESTLRETPEDDTSLLLSTEGRLAYEDVVHPAIAQLRFESDQPPARVIALTELEYLVGRHRDNAIQVADLGVSGFHARIYRSAEGYVIEDLKSRNGTWVNNVRIFETTLTSGDRVHVGSTDMIYELLFATEASS